MGVERLEILERTAYCDGEPFGDTGSYERIDAVAHYAVDPMAATNSSIVDLDRAERGPDGLVRFEGDVTILRPVDPGRSNRTAFVEVPNRGRRTLSGLYNRAATVFEPTAEIDAGDGFLFRHGWTVAWCGWQWDVPRSRARMGLTAPVVLHDDGSPASDWVQLRLQLHTWANAVDLTDHHVGLLGGHTPLPTADLEDDDAQLLVRDGLWGEPVEIARELWRFARDAGGAPAPDAEHVWLDGGFEPGRIYDLIYRTSPLRIPGAGLLAVRDLGAFLGSGAATDPCAGDLDTRIVTGQSQCGRFLRTYLHLGLNLTEAGTVAYDGVLAHIAGGRRGEFNHRGGQPSVQPTPSFGHRFPFADDEQNDARTGRRDGLLERQRALGALPKVFYTNTSSEYWRGDASLAHTWANDGSDVDPPDATRHYLFASTQHGPGVLPLMSRSMFGSRGGNDFNIVDYTPLMRAAATNLRAWIVDETEPPGNEVPRVSDGTAVTRAAVLDRLAGMPTITRPDDPGLWTIRPLDLGPGEGDGVGRYPAEPTGDPYPCTVSAVDDDGNEVAGIRLPDVSVPLATHTGWNPRHTDTGAPHEILEYVGSTVPFAVDETARAASGDPRPSIAERYADKDAFLGRVEAAAQDLVAQRHLLEEDVPRCVGAASRRWDALAEPAAAAAGAATSRGND